MSNRSLTAIERLVETSAVLNDIAIPANSLVKAFARHTFNVWVNNPDDPIYRVLLRGSGTAIRFRGRELLVCTQHQLVGIEHEQVSMIVDRGAKLLTSGGVRYFTRDNTSDAHDIVAYNFSDPVAAFPELRGRFFDLRSIPPFVGFDGVVGFVLTGCPYQDQSYRLNDESDAIDIARRTVTCRLAPDVPSDAALLRLTPAEPLDFDPDGMSGGSAFVIQRVGHEFRADFAGITVRGGKGAFHILKVGAVWSFLDRISASWETEK